MYKAQTNFETTFKLYTELLDEIYPTATNNTISLSKFEIGDMKDTCLEDSLESIKQALSQLYALLITLNILLDHQF